MKLRDIILSQFEPDIASPLIEFGKNLSRIDADMIMFMARKSLCLYDVLLLLGIAPIEKSVVSDRTLDMRLDPFIGKKVALIDDTLILGTTLAKTKRLLETEAKATVMVNVFCADRNSWCRELLQPTSIAIELDHQRLMTFCTAEVRVLSLIPRPYIVDFPLSRPIRIRTGDSQCMLSSVEWLSFKISTKLQERNGVNLFTFFPTDDVLEELTKGFGEQISSLIDIVKVRAFARKQEEVYWTQLVPIVTLKPVNQSDITPLLEFLVERISEASNRDFSKIYYFTNSPQVALKLNSG